MIARTERLPHRQRHEQLLGELLLAEGDGPAGHHDALAALVLALGHLLDDARQSAQRQAMFVLASDDGAAQLHYQATGVLELVALGEGGASATLAGLQLPA